MLDAFENRPALPSEAKAELHRLRELSRRAQTGDPKSRRELREALEKTAPELIAEATDFTRRAQRTMIDTISGSDWLMREALPRRLEAMQREISGEDCTPLEALLAGRVAMLWFVGEVLEALTSAQLQRGKGIKHASSASMNHMFRWQESVNKRFLSSLRGLATLRRLQSGIPSSQTNIQVNVQKQDGA